MTHKRTKSWSVSACSVFLLLWCFQESMQACEQLQQLLSSVEDKRKDLSDYLCEDSSSFSIEELFNTIKTFRGLFLRALKVSNQSQAC